MLVVQRNGKIFLQDVINKTTVCSLIPPASHRIASPCSPVYALNAKQQVLFIRGKQKDCSADCLFPLSGEGAWYVIVFIFHPGDQKTSSSDPSNTKGQTQLFVFRLEQSEIIRRYVVPQPDSSQQQQTLCCHTQEETCDLYLQQRFTFFWPLNLSMYFIFSVGQMIPNCSYVDVLVVFSLKTAVSGWEEENLWTNMEEATGNCSNDATKPARPRASELRERVRSAEML